MTNKKPIRIGFRTHGLGDVVHCCHAMRLYLDRGYDVQIQVEPNKRWVWQAAGVPIYEGAEQLPIHPYYYPDMNKFWDLSTPDHLYSKIAHLFEIAELPKLGTKAEVWRLICNERINAASAVSPEAIGDVAKFLEGLPKPIVLLHSKGTNWQEEKSIPDATAFQLILELLHVTGGSVVTLDWDGRSPTLAHPRVRPIFPTWKHMGTEHFGALCQVSQLMIGVDSGPFHLAQWFPIPTLFVARKIPPVRCCLPSTRATYLVSGKDHDNWTSRGPEWRFAEFAGPEATVKDIVITALKSLQERPGKTTSTSLRIDHDLVVGAYIYRRIGYDERSMNLLPDGKIGDGAAGRERFWAVEQTPVGPVVTIYGESGSPTCHLQMDSDEVLRGQWLHGERMPIELLRVREPGWEKPVPDKVTWNDVAKWEGSSEPPATRVALVTNWGESYQEIGSITEANRIQYADRHKYALVRSRFPGSWGKIDALLAAWRDGDWLWWLDADAVITNPAIKVADLIDPNYSAIVSCDRNGINAGSMLIRTDLFVKPILEDLRKRRDEFDWSNMWEQPGLSMLLWKIHDRVKIVPQQLLNSYANHRDSIECHTWQPGDFVLHCAGLPTADRTRLLKETLHCTKANNPVAANSDLSNDGLQATLTEPNLVNQQGIWIRDGVHGQQDLHVVNDIISENSYRLDLRHKYRENEVVVDIGAHIGTFAIMWHRKNPTARIVCVEACPENIPVLRRNVGNFATVIHAACSYEPGELALLNSVKENGTATGGSTVVSMSQISEVSCPEKLYWKDARRLPKVTLEEIMAKCQAECIDVLKLDCEGSEFSILENSPSIRDIKFLCGEYHGQSRWDALRQRVFPSWPYGHMWAANDLGIFHLENPKFHGKEYSDPT